MIQSGFGDGQCPVYFGYDEKGMICDVVMEYIPSQGNPTMLLEDSNEFKQLFADQMMKGEKSQ